MSSEFENSPFNLVMPGLVPSIHVFLDARF